MRDLNHTRSYKLQAGQVWKVDQGYLYLVEVGERHIRYKMLRHPNSRAAITQMIRMEALLNFLSHTQAELMMAEDPDVVVMTA